MIIAKRETMHNSPVEEGKQFVKAVDRRSLTNQTLHAASWSRNGNLLMIRTVYESLLRWPASNRHASDRMIKHANHHIHRQNRET